VIDEILVVLHLPDLMDKVLETGLDLADKYSARTTLLMVIPKTKILTMFYPSAPHHTPLPLIANSVNFTSKYEKLLSNALAIAKKAKPRLNISTKLVKRRPADKIIEIATRRECTLIVIGSRGMGLLKRIIKRNLCDKVVKKALCPVVIVKTDLPQSK
jgi:nucleotide-binding universal stress UspA family protein